MAEHIFRKHDDNDGNHNEGLNLILGDDGDFFLYVNDSPDSLRYRMPVIGGGKSPNTWFALRHLFNAMKKDSQNGNDEQIEFDFEKNNDNIHGIKNTKAKIQLSKILDDFDNLSDSPELIKEQLEIIKNIL